MSPVCLSTEACHYTGPWTSPPCCTRSHPTPLSVQGPISDSLLCTGPCHQHIQTCATWTSLCDPPTLGDTLPSRYPTLHPGYPTSIPWLPYPLATLPSKYPTPPGYPAPDTLPPDTSPLDTLPLDTLLPYISYPPGRDKGPETLPPQKGSGTRDTLTLRGPWTDKHL